MTNSEKRRAWLLLPLSLLVAAMIRRPEDTVSAAWSALELWATTVVPSLLPFFMAAELLVALGGAELAGRRLSPLMGPLFALPGEAALAVVMGYCSGFPTGAAVAAALRRQGAISAEEGGRLLAFTNNAGPLYVTVAVACGMLRCPAAAPLLALAHYGVDLFIGVMLGLLHRLSQGRAHKPAPPLPPPAARQERQPLALLLKAAAQRAAANLLLIGCYMAFFAVTAALLAPRQAALSPLLRAGLSGAWEMSLGVQALIESGLDLNILLPLIGAQLALGGLSVQMQVLAMAVDTDISPRLYLLCRPLHALLAALLIRWRLPHLELTLTASDAWLVSSPTFAMRLWRSLLPAALIALGWLLLSRKRKLF